MARGEGEGKSGKRAQRRRGGGFRRAGELTRPSLSSAAERYGFAETDVLLRWREVVGEALGDLCRPLRVRYPRARTLGATLVVEADPARAPELEMSSPRILERVNAFYGYRAISRLSITQAPRRSRSDPPSPGFAEAQAPFAGAPVSRPGRVSPDPDPAAARRAGTLAAEIENPALRAALTQLGAYVLSKPRGPL